MATQLERSAATRDKTIAATIECLVELGYSGVTFTAVARRAGISRGAVGHQYPDKQSLVLDVIAEIARRRAAEARSVLAELPGGRERVGAGLDMLWHLFKSSLYVAGLEVYVAGRTDTVLRPRVLALEAEAEDAVRAVIRVMVGPTDRPADLAAHTDAVVNTMRGLALMYCTGNPPEPLEKAWALTRAAAVDSLTALGL